MTTWLSKEDSGGETVFQKVMKSGSRPLAALLSEQQTRDQAAGDGPALHHAARTGDLEAASAALAAQGNPDVFDDRGETPLHAAVRNADRAMAKLLLAHGAGVNVATADGMTPLHWACVVGADEVVETLLAHGASITAQAWNVSGFTPIDMAALLGYKELARRLRSIRHPGLVRQDFGGYAAAAVWSR